MMSVANTRALSQKALAAQVEQFRQGRASNEFSFYFTRLPTGEMDLADRIEAVNAHLEGLKRSPEPLVVRF